MYRFLLLCILPVLCASCLRRNYPTFDDLEIEVVLVNQQGEVTSYFTKGEDITFRYVIRNTSEKTIPYKGSSCPQYHFDVYMEGRYMGDPQPDGSFCTETYLEATLEPHDADYYMLNWYHDPQNPHLSSGEYTVTFHAEVMLQEGKLVQKIEQNLPLFVR